MPDLRIRGFLGKTASWTRTGTSDPLLEISSMCLPGFVADRTDTWQDLTWPPSTAVERPAWRMGRCAVEAQHGPMDDALVPAVVGGAIALAGGAVGLLGKQLFDRRMVSHEVRRAVYVELVTLLMGRRAYMQTAIFSDAATLADLPSEQIDRLNALLKIDATEAVAANARTCFSLLQRFHASRSEDVPVEVDEHGYFRYRGDRVRDLPEPTRNMMMRVALAGIADEYGAAVDDLAAQIKREMHRRL